MITKTVTVDVGERQYILTPTLRGLEAVERAYGDIATALEGVRKLRFETAAYLIATGAGLNANAVEQMKKELFEAGFIKFTGELAEYLGLLANPTGKPVEEDGDQGNQ